MAVADSQRSSKRRKLSPPHEAQNQRSKRKIESEQQGFRTALVVDIVSSNMHQTQTAEIPSVKGLDSSEPAVRRTTLKKIIEDFESRPVSYPFTSTQCLQIWRGFFIAIYMHDSRNALSVQNLLREIAGTFTLMTSKDEKAQHEQTDVARSDLTKGRLLWFVPYHVAFWETLGREWASIDSHRMNKYLLLVRFVLRELFKISLKNSLDGSSDKSSDIAVSTSRERFTASIEILRTTGPLNPSQRKIPDGLRLHVLDVWADEIEAAMKNLKREDEDSQPEEARKDENVVELQRRLGLLREAIESISKSDSGAQRHIRLRAKDTMHSMDRYMKERSLDEKEEDRKH